MRALHESMPIPTAIKESEIGMKEVKDMKMDEIINEYA